MLFFNSLNFNPNFTYLQIELQRNQNQILLLLMFPYPPNNQAIVHSEESQLRQVYDMRVSINLSFHL